MTNDEHQHLQEQIALSRRLSLGFVGTFVPPMGIWAVFTGLRALSQIDANPKLVGRNMARWCFLAGLVQSATLVPAALLLLSRSF
jgi:hypothetical protein